MAKSYNPKVDNTVVRTGYTEIDGYQVFYREAGSDNKAKLCSRSSSQVKTPSDLVHAGHAARG